MCDFISWIEKDGEILFLTDKDVFSARGRELFGDCKDNDVLGHGAIRRYYGKDGVPLQCGKDHEQRDFWNIENLPSEIQALHPEDPHSFMRHWGQMWNGGLFQSDDLCCIIYYAHEEWKAKAWDQLLKQGPSNDDLSWIIRCAPESWKEKASEQLLKQGPSNDDLRCIIEYAPEPWRSKAQKELNKRA